MDANTYILRARTCRNSISKDANTLCTRIHTFYKHEHARTSLARIQRLWGCIYPHSSSTNTPERHEQGFEDSLDTDTYPLQARTGKSAISNDLKTVDADTYILREPRRHNIISDDPTRVWIPIRTTCERKQARRSLEMIQRVCGYWYIPPAKMNKPEGHWRRLKECGYRYLPPAKMNKSKGH